MLVAHCFWAFNYISNSILTCLLSCHAWYFVTACDPCLLHSFSYHPFFFISSTLVICIRLCELLLLRLCLFWVKITSENAFPEMRLFGWFGKFYFPEIEIRWPKKNAFDHGNRFTLLFSLQSISGKCERERERERERARTQEEMRRTRSRDGKIVPLIAILPLRDRAGERSERKIRRGRSWDPKGRSVDRDLAFARSSRWSRSRLREIVPASDPRGRFVEEDREIREEDPSIAISPSRDRAVDRDLATARSRCWSRSRLREIAPARDPRGRIWTVFEFFLGCVFLLLFQTPENIFRKIFWNATKHMEIFSFSEN